MSEEELLPFCECGECGLRVTKKGNRYIHGHGMRGRLRDSPAQLAADKLNGDRQRGVPRPPEACAAISAGKLGKPHTSPAQIAADKLQSEKRSGVPLPQEHCTAISAGTLGIPNSPEHNVAISVGKLGKPNPHTSPAQLTAIERMSGGNDLVTHHWLYDESDLSKNTVQMTRSDHMKLHMLLKKLGYIVPHINIKEI